MQIGSIFFCLFFSNILLFISLPSSESPKPYIPYLTGLEHLGCANFGDLTQFDAKHLTRVTSFAALKYIDSEMNTANSYDTGSYSWLADLVHMKAISLKNVENNFNFKFWPNLQSVAIADVAHLPDSLDQLNAPLITELKLKLDTIGRFSKLREFTNLVTLTIDAQTAANSIFLEIVELKNLRHLEFRAATVFPAIDNESVGLATLPNLEYFSLHASVTALESALFLNEISELPTLKTITITNGLNENPRFMDIIRRFNKVNSLKVFGPDIYAHHAIMLSHKLKGPEYLFVNGTNARLFEGCLCDECRDKNLASSLDYLAVDPAPAVLAMEDHMLDIDEIRGFRSDEREKKMKKHDKTKMQRM